MPSIVILISGRGSNMQALLNAQLPCKIAAVVSNRPDAAGLVTAREQGIPTVVVDHRQFSDRADFDAALLAEVEKLSPDLVVLAGFMRILNKAFVSRFEGRLINIHPSLLPSFTGLHTHRRALEAGVRIHGCTVHFVTPELDCGPVIVQAAVPVYPDDTEDSLCSRVLVEEHRIYPQAVRWFVEGRLAVTENGQVLLKDEDMTADRLIVPKPDSYL